MEVIIANYDWAGLTEDTSVALGYFDGFHKGHQEVLKETLKIAKENNTRPVVLTFDSHPCEFLFPERAPEQLLESSDKALYLGKEGFDKLILLHVTPELLTLSAEEFFEWMLTKLLPKALISGSNYTFGAHKKGTPELLKLWSEKKNILVQTAQDIEVDDSLVSSSRIRTLLKSGEVGEARELLGRYYHLNGIVVTGDGRGRTLGYPTANLSVKEQMLYPENGVYGTKIRIDGKWYEGATSVGTNPSFPGTRLRRVEVNVLDFSGDLYGKEVRVAFCQRLRRELTFSSRDDLIIQLHKDVAETREQLRADFDASFLPEW